MSLISFAHVTPGKARGLGCACVCAVALAFTAAAGQAQTAPQKPATTGRPGDKSVAKRRAAKPAEEMKAEAPPQPEMPKWPVNDSPAPAQVNWDSQGLQIRASNSSLIQILHDYAAETGSKIEGVGKDERIFGSYGPGSAHDVLTQLLSGTGYNVLMFGDLGQGTPREVVLSTRTADTGQRTMARPASEPSYEDSSADDGADEQPEPQPQPLIPPPQVQQPNTPADNNQPMRSPQEIMQEMQQRQQQMQQQQMQQQPIEQQTAPQQQPDPQ